MSLKTAHWTVYGLKDPRSNVIRYVGVTFNLYARLRAHERDCQPQRHAVKRWLLELGAEGLIPAHEVLETGHTEHFEAEQKWIGKLRSEGVDLTNLTDGGPGQRGYKNSPESAQKKREALKGIKRSEEFCAKMRAVAAKRPPDYYKKIAQGRSYGPISDEQKASISASHRDKPWTDARRSAYERNDHPGRRHPHSDETKAKISATKRGKGANRNAA